MGPCSAGGRGGCDGLVYVPRHAGSLREVGRSSAGRGNVCRIRRNSGAIGSHFEHGRSPRAGLSDRGGIYRGGAEAICRGPAPGNSAARRVIVQRPERIVVRWILLALPSALLLNAPFLPARVRATQPSNKTVEITVDGSAGSDTNLGTADRPVKTIGQASQLAMFNRRNGVSTTVIVKPGTYREFVQLTSAGPETGASITFQASPTGAAIVSGSELFTEWQPDPSDARSYVHPWQYRWGGCEHPRGWPAIKDLGLRREMVFVNGSPMKQALARKEMTEGSFFVD